MLRFTAVARVCVRASASGACGRASGSGVSSCPPLPLDANTRPLPLQIRPLPFLHPASPLATASLVPHRGVSTETGKGWYESLADSTAVHYMEQLLVTTQDATGLPWWASIIATTIALRTVVTLPLGMYQSYIISKVESLEPEIAELAKRLRYEVAMKAKDKGWNEKTCRYQYMRNLKRIVSELYIRDNCHPFKASVIVWVQIPMWVCVSLALRNLSLGNTHTPEVFQQLTAGGALWFSDLTMPDSLWILPITLGVTNLLITEIFALRRSEMTRVQRIVTNVIRGVSLVMIPLAATVPSSMALYWCGSSVVGLGHNLLLRSPGFRRLLRIPATRADSDTPYRDLVNAAKTKYLK